MTDFLFSPLGLIAALALGFVLGRISGGDAAPETPIEELERDIEGLSDEARLSIRADLGANRKIAAIKTFREATGRGLKDSRRAVERMKARGL